MASYWLAWALARRGDHDRAWELVGEARVETQAMRPFQDQLAAELLAQTGRWERVPDFLRSSRTYAEEAELLALPVHLDRLEARRALAIGDADRGLALLATARERFGELGAAWERARTELDLAAALTDVNRTDAALDALASAAPDLERANAQLELDRLRELRSGLGD
jgi:hypothetical protein